MPRRCTVCEHPDRPSVDTMLVNRRGFRTIAHQTGLSKWALLRHHDDHLPEVLAKAQAAAESAKADDLLEQLKIIRTKAIGLMVAAEKAGDIRTALAGVRETRACLELLLELEQRLDRRPQINLLVAPEWLTTRAALIEALRPYPDARMAVSARLAALA